MNAPQSSPVFSLLWFIPTLIYKYTCQLKLSLAPVTHSDRIHQMDDPSTGVKWQEYKTDCLLPSNAEVKSIPPLPHTTSWHDAYTQGQLYL